MGKSASIEKMELAKKTCLDILKDNNISIANVRKFVSSILDAIDLVGIENDFTWPEEDEIVKYVEENLKNKIK